MKKLTRLPTVAERIHRGMDELEAAMRSGKQPRKLFKVRTVEVPDPTIHDARSVRRLRARMDVSQAVFAKLLGVSVELVEHWEQGVRAPRPVVRRLLDEISRDPDGFLARHLGQTGRRLRRAG